MASGSAPGRRPSAGAAAGLALLLLLVGGCKGESKQPEKKLSAREALSAAGNECSATDPHSRHVDLALACTTCHPEGGQFGFSGATLPGGTQVSGTITRGTSTAPTTCSVGCHSPYGLPVQPIAWNAGPRACISCHANRALPNAGATPAHVTSDGDAACRGCHDTTAHLGGSVKLVVGNGAGGNQYCISCHGGNGQTLEGRTAPVLVGWGEPAGDWHGTRAGAGWGGTLTAPLARGQGELTCRTCHDPHVSGETFMFAATVNGNPVPRTVDRAGVGAQAMCASCHQGERHAGCLSCHVVDRVVDGDACFFCHGHEGVQNFPPPVQPAGHPNATGDCRHCHQKWLPTPEYVAPVFAYPAKIAGVGTSAATITWWTDEPSTSWIEYGDPGQGLAKVAGDGALVTTHTVALANLAPHTKYTFRSRSADALHNTARSGLYLFATGSVGGPPAPTLTDRTDYMSSGTPVTTTLVWGPVTSPDGHAVQYRCVVAKDPQFTTIVGDSGWIVGQRYDVRVDATLAGNQYYWYVVARDAVDGDESAWSLDTFKVTLRDLGL